MSSAQLKGSEMGASGCFWVILTVVDGVSRSVVSREGIVRSEMATDDERSVSPGVVNAVSGVAVVQEVTGSETACLL